MRTVPKFPCQCRNLQCAACTCPLAHASLHARRRPAARRDKFGRGSGERRWQVQRDVQRPDNIRGRGCPGGDRAGYRHGAVRHQSVLICVARHVSGFACIVRLEPGRGEGGGLRRDLKLADERVGGHGEAPAEAAKWAEWPGQCGGIVDTQLGCLAAWPITWGFLWWTSGKDALQASRFVE